MNGIQDLSGTDKTDRGIRIIKPKILEQRIAINYV